MTTTTMTTMTTTIKAFETARLRYATRRLKMTLLLHFMAHQILLQGLQMIKYGQNEKF